jgi:NAD(P)-dependent dehydrogenase (short-subunit alcohol dehydrogenase family)
MSVRDPILVFGATGGVGQALCRRLAADGLTPYPVGRDRAATATLAGELGTAHGFADARDPAQVAAAVTTAAGATGRLGGLAWCVGSIVLKPLKAVTEEDLVTAFHLNAVAPTLAVRAGQSALQAGEGAVLLFSTVAVSQGFANHAVVSAAKGAVEGLTRALAAELAPTVRVNAIAPSLTRTRMAQALTGNEAMAKAIAGLHALPRLGRPDDIAALAALLLDNRRAGWITGQIIGVDGGRASLRTKG